MIAVRAQGVDDMLAVVVEREAAVRQPKHPAAMRRLPGEQGGAAGRAGRRGAERLPEEQPLLRQLLKARGRNSVAIRLNIAPGVV